MTMFHVEHSISPVMSPKKFGGTFQDSVLLIQRSHQIPEVFHVEHFL